ncbi:MAG TPA: hypothetical protein VFX16_07225 [Pseudonocardiaceae bacterium]|nr:hypothetical protein [Pseudonocardiaceae bacterium]
MVHVLTHTPDPETILTRYAARIDDAVISGLLDESYLAQKSGDHGSARRWCELAVRASLLGGTAKARAEALVWHAAEVLNNLDAAAPSRDDSLALVLDEARHAIGIYSGLDSADDLVTATQLVVRAHAANDDPAAAVRALLPCVALVDRVDDELAGMVAERLTNLFWDLRPSDQRSDGLLAALERLLNRIDDDALAAALWAALAEAHSERGEDDATLMAGTQAAARLHELGEFVDEFLARYSAFEHFAPRDNLDLAIELGLACLASAPAGAPPRILAEAHHMVGFVYERRGDIARAIPEFRQADDILVEVDGSKASGDLLFEAAMYLADRQAHHEARELFELVLSRSNGVGVFWATHWQLATIDMIIGDFGTAIEHVEEALALAISQLPHPAFRIASLERSAHVHMGTGDVETTYRRFRMLVPLLAEPITPTTVEVSRMYGFPVAPPPRSGMLRGAAIAARSAGHAVEAKQWERMADDCMDDEVPMLPLPDDDEFDDEFTDELVRLASISGDAARGMALRYSNPVAALALLEKVKEADSDLAEMLNIDLVIGLCHRRLGDHDAAIATLTSVVANGSPSSHSYIVLVAHLNLAAMFRERCELEPAYEHLVAAVGQQERSRASLGGIEERQAFLASRLSTYHRLIEVCVILGRYAEAFAAVQQIKSRSLLDMVAQEDHRPIDSEFDKRVTAMRAEREEWIARHIDGVGSDGEPEVVHEWPRIRMLKESIGYRDAMAELNAERERLGLFDRLHDEGTPLDFHTIRQLLE